MITRVLDAQGSVLHDCDEAGCEVSWDGYNIATGEPHDGRADVDTEKWNVQGDTAQLKKDS